MLNSLFKNKKNIIPFKSDLLFNFFNKKTVISDTYIQDPVSNLKLYPKKSGAVKATAANSCIPVSKTILTSTKKIISVFKHKLSDLNNFGYAWAGANASSPYATTGLYLTSGKSAYSFYWKGSTGGACAINAGQLEDDNWYLCTQTVGETNISMKMNKLTIVNNAVVVGSDINSTTTAKGTEELTGDRFGILSACYSNGSYNYASGNQMVYIKFLDANDNVLLSFNFSEGAGQQVFDIISGNAYQIYNITESAFWNYTQDFNHHNFRYGFTLYQKAGADDIRVPNKKDGSEITPVSIPSGYSRIANYKECRQTFNQCENVFVLDDATIAEEFFTVAGGAPEFDVNGDYYYYNDYSGKPQYKIADKESYLYYDGMTWCCYNLGVNRYTSFAGDEATPDLATWLTITVTKNEATGSDLYLADPDRVLFNEDGTAKEIEIGSMYSEIVDLVHDRGHLYINSDSNKNMMLYKNDKGVGTPEDLKIWKYVEK